MRAPVVLATVFVSLVFSSVAHGAEPIAAAFAERSYAPSATARLRIWTDSRTVTVQVFRSGPERVSTRRNDLMNGVAVADPRRLRLPGGTHGPFTVNLRMHFWPSGLYFARLRTSTGAISFAPFVLRPAFVGASRVAVVIPTNTWQAYNFRDVDGDGIGDTWYASPNVCCVDLARPYLNRGVPPKFRGYDLGFLRWLARTDNNVEFFADDDLERFRRGATLARLYDLIVFPGHEEYVTERAYDLVTSYRNLGGNLMFLSANNFFRRVTRTGHVIRRGERWRDIGRPESGLIGVQYVNWNEDRWPNGPYTVVGARAAPWLFAGTGLRNGDRFGNFGIEIDARTPASPAGTRVLARATDVFGPGQTAEMTYYETSAGAKVFAAGVMNFGGSTLQRPVRRMVTNLWTRLRRP